MRKPRRCAIRSIINTISISQISRKYGAAAAWWLRGCWTSRRFHCWSSRRWSVSPVAFRIPAKGAGQFLPRLNRPRPRRFLAPRFISDSHRAAKMILRPKCFRPCVFNLAGTSRRRQVPKNLWGQSQSRLRIPIFRMNHEYSDTNSLASPCVMTICGATGDLTKRKLVPALCNLAEEKLLPEQFAIVGFAADDFTTESFRKTMMQEIPKYASSPIDPQLLDSMCQRMHYVKGDFQDPEAYTRLEQQITEEDRKYNAQGNRLFYLAVAPRF